MSNKKRAIDNQREETGHADQETLAPFDSTPYPIRRFLRIWCGNLPVSSWDCGPGEVWAVVSSHMRDVLDELKGLELSQSLSLQWKDHPDQWYRIIKLLEADPVPTAEIFREIANCLETHTPVDNKDLQPEHSRLFWRAAVEAGDPASLTPLLSHLKHSIKEDESLSELTVHLVMRASAKSSDTTVRTHTSDHVVFHHVERAYDSELRKSLERFQALVGRPLPYAGELPDADQLGQQLQMEAPWLDSVTRVLQRRLQLSVLGQSGATLPPLLFVGLPGTGKSWLALRIAELYQLPYLIIAAAGASDNMSLKGTARGWGTSRPGRLVDFIAECQVANPLVIVDEIDKVGDGKTNGNLLDLLHQLLEPQNASQWTDEHLQGRCDLSRVSWIATANSVSHLPSSLLSRFQVIEVQGPQPEHRVAMLHGVLRELAKDLELEFSLASWLSDAEWSYLESHAKTPRQARRLANELIALKIGEARKNAH
jgi:hypothetical protein